MTHGSDASAFGCPVRRGSVSSFCLQKTEQNTHRKTDSGYTRLTSEVPTLTRTRHPKYAILQAPHPSPSPLPPPSYPPVKQVHSLIESITTHRIAHKSPPSKPPNHNTQHTPSAKLGAHQVIQQSKNHHRNIENRIPEDTFISQ